MIYLPTQRIGAPRTALRRLPPPLPMQFGLMVISLVLLAAPVFICSAADVVFSKPILVGQSNHSDACVTSGDINGTRGKDGYDRIPCHYWFPNSVLQLGTGPAAVFLMAVQRCGDPAGPSPANRDYVASRDAGRSFAPIDLGAWSTSPFYNHPMPAVPLRKDKHIATIREDRLTNFTTLMSLDCAQGSCSGSLLRWRASINPLAITTIGAPSVITVAGVERSKIVSMSPYATTTLFLCTSSVCPRVIVMSHSDES